MAKPVAKPVKDEWQCWEGGLGGRLARGGCFISMSPTGNLLLSRELTAQLDPAKPNAKIYYHVTRKLLRIVPQTEIVAGAYRWRRSDEMTGHLSAAAGLKSWGLLPEKVVLYPAEYHPATGDEPAHIEADLKNVLETIERKSPRKTRKAASGPPIALAKCADCGVDLPVTTTPSGARLIGPHPDPSGIPCFCRRPEKVKGDSKCAEPK
jgi:hypothetical protein